MLNVTIERTRGRMHGLRLDEPGGPSEYAASAPVLGACAPLLGAARPRAPAGAG